MLIVGYGHQFDPTIPIVEGEQYEGGVDEEDSDWKFEVYSSPDGFLCSLPRDRLDDVLRRCVLAGDEMKAKKKKIWVQKWLSQLH